MTANSTKTAEPTDSLGDYELHIAWEGFASIRQRSSGEIMHSRSAPMDEARHLYVEQSGLAQRLTLGDTRGPFIIWDVGLGAGANAMAAIQCYRNQSQLSPVRSLQIVSFENDLDSLRLALRHLDHFPYLDDEAPRALLETGRWQSGNLSWILVEGDFEEKLHAASGPPDVIFYDMFSSRCSPGPWDLATFEDLGGVCHGHASTLVTYTRSTANRANLLAAGFYVASGPATGLKEETTIALSPLAATEEESHYNFLGQEWLEKWKRSAAMFPAGMADAGKESFRRRILSHPQFNCARAHS